MKSKLTIITFMEYCSDYHKIIYLCISFDVF